ncbi:MAG: MFS transporter [Actinobacteria bacterium]|nr:MFS transporter [Actinomycetota bacterium]
MSEQTTRRAAVRPPAPPPRLVALIAGSSLASAGWGAILPYLYADIDGTRHLGGFVAAATFTAFALGSLLAAPVAGRLADGRSPVLVASLSRVALAIGVLALGLTSAAAAVWLAAAFTGAAVAVTQPAIGVLLLAWTPEHRSREVFAWQFIGLSLAMALGGFVGGLLVDLSSPSGTHPIYYIAAATALASAIAVCAAGRGTGSTAVRADVEPDGIGLRALLHRRPVRWLLALTVLIMLACYAQYESGLPAYALGFAHVQPSLLGTGVALNAIMVAILTAPVVRLTRRHEPTTLLAACAGIWIVCWLVIAAPLAVGGIGASAVLLGYAGISFGETMLAPVLSPLAASVAPEGATGRTLAAVTGASTLANAVGPVLSGILLALQVPSGFIALQLLCCIGAIALAVRLGAQRRTARPFWDLDVADELIPARVG